MPNINLIKKLLLGEAQKQPSIHDIFNEEELEKYEDEIFVYNLDELGLNDEGVLSDESLRIDSSLDDVHVVTDEMRVKHGLYYIDAALEKLPPPDIISETGHMIKNVDLGDGETSFVCFDVYCENNGMGMSTDYENARLVNVFKTYRAICEHYEELGLFCLGEEDEDYRKAQKKFILERWEYTN